MSYLAPPAPPLRRSGQGLSVTVPDPLGRTAFSYVYRIAAGLIAVFTATVVIVIGGAINGWQITTAWLVTQAVLIVVVTGISERLLEAAYHRYRQRVDERTRREAAEKLLSIIGTRTAVASEAPRALRYAAVKRAFDVVGAGAGLLAVAPTLALIAVLVRMTYRGSVFVREAVPGISGREFTLYRFRTSASGNEVPFPSQVGSFLRATALDELPQLWNVLRGDLSLVGPRPSVLAQIKMSQRPLPPVKPGLADPWILAYRSTQRAEMVDQINAYAKHWSLGIDLRILLLTVSLELTKRTWTRD